jgi:hypothetical protein
MSSSTTEIPLVRAQNVTVTEDTLTAELSDGRSISVPLAWYPRLVHGTPDERSNWRLIRLLSVPTMIGQTEKLS